MLHSVGNYLNVGVKVLEMGLAHPTFLGRLVSWGVFYGALYYSVKKIYMYVEPKFSKFLDSFRCHQCHNSPETLKGEVICEIGPVIRKDRAQEQKKDVSAGTQISQPGEPEPIKSETAQLESEAVKKK